MRVFRFRLLWAFIGGTLAYALLVKVAPIRPRGDGLRAVFLVLSGWGMVTYWRPFRRALTWEGWPPPSLLYAVMAWLICTAININCTMGLFWRLSGQPAFLINNPVFDFWVVLGIMALLIAVTVPDLFGKDVPPRDKIQIGSVWLMMFALVCYLTLVRPDLDPLADTIRPWLDSGYEYQPDIR